MNSQQLVKRGNVSLFYCLKKFGGLELDTHSQNSGAAQSLNKSVIASVMLTLAFTKQTKIDLYYVSGRNQGETYVTLVKKSQVEISNKQIGTI